MAILTQIIPARYKYLSVVLLLVAVFLSGAVFGLKSGSDDLSNYLQKQNEKTVLLMKARQEVIIQQEVKWRDRIEIRYLKGEQIEKSVKDFITPVANAACVINDGFVRIHDSAWTSTDTGVAAKSDEEPAGVSLAEVAEVNAHNAKVALAWKEIALGLRETYEKIRNTTVK